MIDVKEKVVLSIDDCRSLSRFEMLGFIITDVYTEESLPANLLWTVVDSWSISCDPENKSIIYGLKHGFTITFIPKGVKGIEIKYDIYVQNPPYSTFWSIEEIEESVDRM